MRVAYEERVVDVREDSIFRDDVINLLESKDLGLLEHFNGDKLIRQFVSGKPDSTERT